VARGSFSSPEFCELDLAGRVAVIERETTVDIDIQ
jgi:hypothetical protein